MFKLVLVKHDIEGKDISIGIEYGGKNTICTCIRDNYAKEIVKAYRDYVGILELNNEMAGGIMEELREILTEFPCYHKKEKEQCDAPPMLFAEGFICHINWGREQSYWECIYALRNNPKACSLVYSLLQDKKEHKDEKETQKDVVEKPLEDRG